MFDQLTPSVEDCHCHVGVIAGFHVPLVAVNVAPIWADPEMEGGTVLTGVISPGSYPLPGVVVPDVRRAT